MRFSHAFQISSIQPRIIILNLDGLLAIKAKLVDVSLIYKATFAKSKCLPAGETSVLLLTLRKTAKWLSDTSIARIDVL